MSTDFEKGLRKTIDLSVKSKDFTADVLRSAMQDFLSGKSRRKGRVSMKQLSEHSGKLENVEIKGIADFLSIAKKYDIDYAVKKEPDSDTYHVFFQAGKMEVKLSITLDTFPTRIMKRSGQRQSLRKIFAALQQEEARQWTSRSCGCSSNS